jgi:hypothetical protein
MKDRSKKEAKKKLAIIVPYRNRESHLNIFVPYIEEYLGDKFEYKIFVIEQKDNKPFNRGKLLNAGFKESGSDFDYYCFHDVDMLPIDADYSYCEQPTHLANTVDGEQSFYNYFGGVTILSKLDFKIINGYSNEYWGWGFEDDDLLQRCIYCNLSLDKRTFGIDDERYLLNYFHFNGVDSFINIPFKNFKKILDEDFSISIKFKPDDLVNNINREYDEYTVFSIPGFNFSLSYNSFKRYKLDIWDVNEKAKSVVSDISPDMWVHATITRNSRNKMVELYINGKFIGGEFVEELYNYNVEDFYLGVANPSKNYENYYFKGLINEFAVFDKVLSTKEMEQIYRESTKKSLLNNFGKYKSSKNLKIYYDFKHYRKDKLIDISGNEFNAEIVNCQNNTLVNSKFMVEAIVPYKKECKFKSLKHTNNSVEGNRWVHEETRKNQLRFNSIKEEALFYSIEGLNTLRYKKVEEKELSEKAKMISIEL